MQSRYASTELQSFLLRNLDKGKQSYVKRGQQSCFPLLLIFIVPFFQTSCIIVTKTAKIWTITKWLERVGAFDITQIFTMIGP